LGNESAKYFYWSDAFPVAQSAEGVVLFFSVLTAIFPGEPGLAGFIGAKDDGSGGGDNRSYKTCKAPVESSSPTNQQ